MATVKKSTSDKTTSSKRGRGRPKAEFDKKQFCKLIGLGCTAKEICWFFSTEDGRPANPDTLSKWCKREFDMTFEEYKKENGGVYRNYQLRLNQIKLSAKSAPMAIFLGKNYLGQKDCIETVDNTPIEKLDDILKGIKENALVKTMQAESKAKDVDLNE
jgi:hypothetical protein